MDEIHILQLQESSILSLVEKDRFNFTSSLLLKDLKIGDTGKRARKENKAEKGASKNFC